MTNSISSVYRLTCCISLLFALPGYAANYYINSRTGNDNNPGNTGELAWKSLVNLEKNTFMPGDSILFARGTSYTGGFVFNSSGSPEKPIVFSSYSLGADVVLKTPRTELTPLFLKYGAGPAPSFTNPDWNVLNGNIFRIQGNYIVIDGLYFHDNTNPPGSDKTTKNVQKMGAIYLATGTHHHVVKNCEFFHTPVGIKVKSTHSLITRNYLHDASVMMAYSWGPIAIMVVRGNNEICFNRVENYGAYGGPYGSDGGVIELDGVDDDFKASNVNIHHNTSVNNHGFLEIAARNVDSITVAYNLSDDRNQFIGGGSMKVNIYNNTVIRTREPNVDRYIFWTFNHDATRFTVRNNIFVFTKDIHVFGPYVKPEGHKRTYVGEQVHDHNLYFSPGNPDPIGIPPGKNDRIADPQFVDAANRNFHIKKSSPAAGNGVALDYAFDLDQRAINKPSKPSIGAFEY
ncbi:hypothetical protein FW774_07490 [Pedobacter sp. BS3]|uniref:hypothetical protein n=1 Tax=Pedobacter sp. BS3 TaxID=2567937 RepID=UPI0011EEB238|nr:hypothetical protein [Pedobacter sp. BS3]TZF84813.1 hypothetical protein FW774_07490 [Pedobacter sp. BS3]